MSERGRDEIAAGRHELDGAGSASGGKRSAKIGAWLFRWRSYLPLALLVVVLPALRGFSYPFGSHSWNLAWEMFCFSISLFGLIVRGYTVGHAPKHTSGRNTKRQVADRLNTTGIYSVVRNPLYLGNFFMALGVALFFRSGWVCAVYVVAFWLYYGRIIAAEQSFLRDRFGREYGDYSERTPALVPNWRLWRPNVLPFSLRSVLKREYSGFFALIAVFALLDVASSSIVEGSLVFEPVWAALSFAGLLVYVTLRTLRKKTKLLHVEGR